MFDHERAERLRKQAAILAESATTLSDYLVAIETYLQELPSKQEVRVPEFQPLDESLSFTRRKSSDWRLVYFELNENEYGKPEPIFYEVTSAPIRIKAAAAKLLPQLLDMIEREIEDSINLVVSGLESIRTIEMSESRDSGKEAKNGSTK